MQFFTKHTHISFAVVMPTFHVIFLLFSTVFMSAYPLFLSLQPVVANKLRHLAIWPPTQNTAIYTTQRHTMGCVMFVICYAALPVFVAVPELVWMRPCGCNISREAKTPTHDRSEQLIMLEMFHAVTSTFVKFVIFTSSTCSVSKDRLKLRASAKRAEGLSVSFLQAAHQWAAYLKSLSTPPQGLLNIHALIKQFYRCYLPGDDKSTAPGWALHADENVCARVCVWDFVCV